MNGKLGARRSLSVGSDEILEADVGQVELDADARVAEKSVSGVKAYGRERHL
jgi:hypothetical protein